MGASNAEALRPYTRLLRQHVEARVFADGVQVLASKEAAIGAALNRRELKELNELLQKVLLEFERES